MRTMLGQMSLSDKLQNSLKRNESLKNSWQPAIVQAFVSKLESDFQLLSVVFKDITEERLVGFLSSYEQIVPIMSNYSQRKMQFKDLAALMAN